MKRSFHFHETSMPSNLRGSGNQPYYYTFLASLVRLFPLQSTPALIASTISEQTVVARSCLAGTPFAEDALIGGGTNHTVVLSAEMTGVKGVPIERSPHCIQ
jgi:hypothetical protein